MSAKMSRFYPWLVWGLGAAFFFWEYFARVSPGVIVVPLMKAYGVNAEGVGSLSACFYYAYVGMQVPVGTLVDRHGPHKWLTITAALCGLSCILFAHAPSFFMAQIARFVMGFGAAFAFVGALKLATNWFSASRFGLLAGATQALGMLGAAFGEGPLSLLVHYVGWRYAVDLIGFILLVVALLIGVLVRNRLDDGVAKTAFVKPKLSIFQSLKVVLASPGTWLIAVVAGLLYAPTAIFAELWGVAYLHHVYHLQNSVAASGVSLIFIGWAVGSPIMGYISDRIQRRKPILYGSILASIVFVCVILYCPYMSVAMLYVCLFLYGVSNVGVALTYTVAREIHQDDVAGTSMSVTNMVSVLIGASFQPVVGWLIDLHWNGQVVDGVHAFSAADYRFALMVLPIFLLLALVVCYFVKESHPSRQCDRR